jgi:Arc/MetJ-type ribon-helix-helix transcriptional regulator
MRRSDEAGGKLSVSLTSQQLAQIGQIVEAGEFGSAAAVVREALRAWLHRRALHAGEHGAQRLRRTLEARQEVALGAPSERVELLFDAGDAKA